MNDHAIMGVRGNHDQPVSLLGEVVCNLRLFQVIQWRTWMEWAGGENWETFIDNLSGAGDPTALRVLKEERKMYPSDWKWKGEHWQIAR